MVDVEFSMPLSKASTMLYVNDADVVNFIFMVDVITHVPAKKPNLMALSPVFNSMFSDVTRQQRVVTVDAMIEVFKEFLQFFHLADAKLAMGNMKGVARLAKDYEILAYVNSCLEEFRTELTFENVCWAYQLSIFFGNHRMKKSCENYITVFTKECLASDAFHHLDKDVLKNILQLNSIACTNSQLFEACFEWAQFACRRVGIDDDNVENVQQQLDDCVRTDDSNDVEHMAISGISNKMSLSFDDFEKITFDRKSTFEKIIHKKRSNPFSDRDELRIMADDSPWFSTSSYFKFEAPSPIACSLSGINQVLFSVSHPVLLRNLELKHFHCKTKKNNYDLKLMVEIFEYSDLSFKESGNNRVTIVFQESVKIRINTNQLESANISPCIFINPRKMYKFTWRATSESKLFQINTVYYDIKTNTSNWTDSNLKLKLHHGDGLNYNQAGIIHKLTFKHLYDLRW